MTDDSTHEPDREADGSSALEADAEFAAVTAHVAPDGEHGNGAVAPAGDDGNGVVAPDAAVHEPDDEDDAATVALPTIIDDANVSAESESAAAPPAPTPAADTG